MRVITCRYIPGWCVGERARVAGVVSVVVAGAAITTSASEGRPYPVATLHNAALIDFYSPIGLVVLLLVGLPALAFLVRSNLRLRSEIETLRHTASTDDKSPSDTLPAPGDAITSDPLFHRMLFERLPVGLVLSRMTGELVEVNAAYARLIGRTIPETLELTYWDITPNAYRDAEEAQRAALQEHGRYGPYEKEYIHKDGHLVPVRLNGILVERNGETVAWSCVEDISDTRAVETSLLHREEQYRTIFESAPVGLIISDASGKTVAVNPAACAMHGYTREEFLTLTPTDFIHKNSHEKFERYMASVMSGGEIRLSAEDLRRDGTTFHIEVIGVPIRYEGARHGLGILQDVTAFKQAERELRTYKERLRIVLETLPIMLWATDADGIITVSEGKSLAHLGINSGDTTGTNIVDQFAPYPDLVDAARACLEGQALSVDTSVGDTTFESHFRPTVDDKGAVTGMSAITFDSTDRRAAENALRLSEEKHRVLVENTREWIWEIRLDAGHVFSNPAIESILGYPVDTILNTDTFELLHPDDRDSVQAGLQECIEKRSGWNDWILRWRHRDGAYRFLESNAAPVLDMAGNLTGFRGVDRDITERLEAERLLHESLQISADFMASVPSGLIIYQFKEPDRLYLENANAEAARLLDTPLLDLHGAEFGDLWHYPGDDKIKQDFINVVQTGGVWSQDYLRHDGDEIVLALRARAFLMPGRRIGVAFEDILDRKRVENELERYRHHLEDLVAERTSALESAQQELLRKERLATLGQIIATVSHELRNPLGTVRMSVFTIGHMLETNHLDRIPAVIERADRGVVRCDRIIEELLDFTRVRVLDREETPIDSWLRDVIEEMGAVDGIEYVWNLQANAIVQIDGEQFRRAIINLVNNAVQAMEEPESPGKQLTLSTLLDEQDIVIEVRDSGPGMPAEVLAKIFEPLFSTKGFGVGLGVPIIREIIEAHSGTIHYESFEGAGTVARIRLPADAGTTKLASSEP